MNLPLKKLLGASVAFLAMASSSWAWLTGDTITLTHYFPDMGNPNEIHSVTVANDNSDLTSFLGGAYQVDAGASSVNVQFMWDGGYYWTPSTFNGLVVSDIDSMVTGVSVSTNLVGWDNSRISFTGNSISANWQNLSFNSQSYFNVEVQQSQSVPDTASTLGLFGAAVLVCAGLRRKFAKA